MKIKIVNKVMKTQFPLNGNQRINIYKAFDQITEKFPIDQCTYDDQFHRITFRMGHFTANVFYTGKVMVFGNCTCRELDKFLQEIWVRFLKKNIVKRTI